MQRVSICDSLLKRNNSESFLKEFIKGGEKWVTNDKNRGKERKRKISCSKHGQAPQTTAKPALTWNKVMLCVL